MRLYLIDKNKCNQMMENLINGIKIAYEMQAIFGDHLKVDFLPERYNIHKDSSHSEIILQTEKEIIRRSYNFDNPHSKENLRQLIW